MECQLEVGRPGVLTEGPGCNVAYRTLLGRMCGSTRGHAVGGNTHDDAYRYLPFVYPSKILRIFEEAFFRIKKYLQQERCKEEIDCFKD